MASNPSILNWEASFNPLDAQFSVSHVQYWETSFNPLDVSASVVRSMSVPTKTFLSLSRRVSRDLQSRAINRVLNNRDASCKVAQSHAISTVVRKRKESLLRFGGATPCVVRSRDSSPIDVSTDKNVPVTFSACQSRFAESRSIVDVSTGKGRAP